MLPEILISTITVKKLNDLSEKLKPKRRMWYLRKGGLKNRLTEIAINSKIEKLFFLLKARMTRIHVAFSTPYLCGIHLFG